MSDIVITILFDCALAILLVATISYCAKLSRRIHMLQDSKSELAGMIAQFDASTQRAMTSLAELQTVSKKITDALQLKIDKANFLADDLAFMIEKGSKLTTQLEQAKTARAAAPAPAPARTFEPRLEFDNRSGPQLVKPKPVVFPQATALPDNASRQRAMSSLEAVLQRLSSGSGSTPPDAPTSISPQVAKSAPRTDAERQLLEALKAGR